LSWEEAELYICTVQTSQPGDDLVPVVEAFSSRLAVRQVARRATYIHTYVLIYIAPKS